MDKYYEFEKRLELFIDKFYKYSIIKGVILFITLFACIVLSISVLEYLSWFSQSIRLFLFLSALISALFIFNYFLVIPLMRYFGILNRLTKRKTEKLLRKNIPEIQDYLLNTIELIELEKSNRSDLLESAIRQKILKTSNYDFQQGLDSKKVIPLLKYAAAILFLYLLIFFVKPTILSEGTDRIIHYDKRFEKFIGYSIVLLNPDLVVEKGSNLDFCIIISGDIVPSFVSYFIGTREFLMTKVSPKKYCATIKNINSNFNFRVGNDQYLSEPYRVKVIKPPFLENYSMLVKYPVYTGKLDEEFQGVSNLKIPSGSLVSMKFACLNSDDLFYKYKADSALFSHNDKYFIFEKTFLHSEYYQVSAVNSDLTRVLIPNSFISVVPDAYPEIDVIQLFDTNNKRVVYFKGNISDDYGFSKLVFIVNNNKRKVPINVNLNNEDFFFTYEFEGTDLLEFSYYFEVFDNDEISGFKSSKSKEFLFKIPSADEITDFKKKQDEDILQKMEKSILLAQEFKRDIESIKQKLYSDKLSSFEKQQLIHGLNEKQDILEEILNEFTKQNSNKNNQFNSFNEQSEEILKKQEEVQKLLENVMTDELRALLEELEKLSLENRNKDFNNMLDKLDRNYDELSNQLDRNLEQLKKFEIENDLIDIIKKLDDISENQKYLNSTNISDSTLDSLLNMDIEKSMELSQSYEKVMKNNEELKNPINFDNLESDFKELREQLENSKSVISKDAKTKKDKFSDNSKKAQELSDKINSQINNNRGKEDGENAESLRQVLENLLYFSFMQEALIQDFNVLAEDSPVFSQKVKSQNVLKDKFSIIKDSLLALSIRTAQLGNHISKKVYLIDNGLFDIDLYFKNNDISKVEIIQRNVLEASNDLILLLSESLKNMENSGEGSGESSNRKKKPKQSKPSLSEMRKSQEGMKKQLESLIKEMKDGKNSGGKQNNEQLGKMLAQQEIFKELINQLQNGNSVGKDFAKQLNEINKMLEQNRRDLIRGNINQETLNRQNQIITRMLEAEKSEKERELDDERRSIESKEIFSRDPNKIFEQKEMEIEFNDILNTNSFKLKNFYRNKYQEYLKNIN